MIEVKFPKKIVIKRVIKRFKRANPYLHIKCKFADDRSKRPSERKKPKELK